MNTQDRTLIGLNEEKISRINREIALTDNEDVIENLTIKRNRIDSENQQIKNKYINESQ